MEIKSTCKICGNKYIKRNARSKYCSDDCKKEATRRRQEQWRKEHPGYMKNWHNNRPDYREQWAKDHPNYDRDRSRVLRKSVERKAECAVCGKMFKTYHRDAKTCSRECHNKYRSIHHKQKTEKLKKNGEYDTTINLRELYNKANGNCYICGGKCNFEDKTYVNGAFVIGKQYPTIDHIIPASKGGTHTWDNVALAHNECNARKGDNTG